MTNPLKRSRSNTSVSTKSTHRPLSRASTTSLQSFDHHDSSHDLSQIRQQNGPHPSIYHHQHQQFNTTYPPLEPALIQAIQHASQRDNMQVDPSLHVPAYPAPDAMQSQHGHNGVADPSQFDHRTAQALQAALGQPHIVHTSTAELEDKKKKGSNSSSATNDKELREMLARNEGRALKDVAAEVIATDRTSKAEKSKQLFAMLWLKSVCRIAKTSVPRNRVYSKYATNCGDQRVIPLNPASFGKLVRVIFPGIQTRRLGVRGESKYHYVDLALLEDSPENNEIDRNTASVPASSRPARQNSVGTRIDFNTMPRLTADTAAFPPQDHVFEPSHTGYVQGPSKGRLFANIYSPDFHSTRSTPSMYDYELRFPPVDTSPIENNVEVALPDLANYLPPKTDVDAAEALVALYRTHCTSLIDSVRYCREKQFFRLFASFHGTLTVPVQKLFAQPEIAPWIRECDWMMYQKMIGNVSQLTLQVAPPQVLRFLDNVSKTLHSHISKVFQTLPPHTREAKLEPATLFAHLIRQMLRVNSTAHAAAVFLSRDEVRDQMWGDWKAYVNVKRIMENELPECGHEEVFNILSCDVRSMLLPLNTQMYLPDGTFYQETTTDAERDASNETVIDRIAALLGSLPSRFPHASTRTILNCVNGLGSAAIREITVEGGASFQAWWLTKTFIDEMGHWLTSLGGFLDHKPPNFGRLTFSPGIMDGPLDSGMTNGGSNNDSRYSSMDADFGASQSFMTTGDMSIADTNNSNHNGNDMGNRSFNGQFDQVNFDLVMGLDNSQHDQNHDDSAIALMDDSLEAKVSGAVQSLNAHLEPVRSALR